MIIYHAKPLTDRPNDVENRLYQKPMFPVSEVKPDEDGTTTPERGVIRLSPTIITGANIDTYANRNPTTASLESRRCLPRMTGKFIGNESLIHWRADITTPEKGSRRPSSRDRSFTPTEYSSPEGEFTRRYRRELLDRSDSISRSPSRGHNRFPSGSGEDRNRPFNPQLSKGKTVILPH